MSILVSIAQALGLRKALPAANRGRVVRDLSLWEQGARIGGGLTPSQVSNIIREADGGYTTRLMDLANECRQKDCHLQAVLAVNEETIAGLDWQLVLPEDARAKDRRAAKWIEETLRANTQLPRLIGSLAGGTYYGFDVNEIIWRKDGGKLVPDRFEHLSPRRFGFRQSDGAFVLRDQGMPNDGIDFRNEWKNKFVVSQPRVTGDAPHREGLCRVLVWATLFRTWTVADWLKTAELTWKPWRIGTYKKGVVNDEDREGLEDVLDQLSTTGWAVKSDSCEIDIEWPAGTTSAKSTHSELVNILAQEMSKATLGQTETVQSSSSSGYGQAKVHDAVRKDIREGRARQVGSDVTRDLITPMADLNFGDVIVPRFEFVTEDGVELKSFSEAIERFAKAGVLMPAAWVRETAGIPEPEEGDETIGGAPEPEEGEDADDEISIDVEEPEEEPATDQADKALTDFKDHVGNMLTGLAKADEVLASRIAETSQDIASMRSAHLAIVESVEQIRLDGVTRQQLVDISTTLRDEALTRHDCFTTEINSRVAAVDASINDVARTAAKANESTKAIREGLNALALAHIEAKDESEARLAEFDSRLTSISRQNEPTQ